jgi:hypothetical protein
MMRSSTGVRGSSPWVSATLIATLCFLLLMDSASAAGRLLAGSHGNQEGEEKEKYSNARGGGLTGLKCISKFPNCAKCAGGFTTCDECIPGFTFSPTHQLCIDLAHSVEHCGEVDAACPLADGGTARCDPDPVTGKGTCSYVCLPNQELCGSACKDLKGDAENCGACAKVSLRLAAAVSARGLHQSHTRPLAEYAMLFFKHLRGREARIVKR